MSLLINRNCSEFATNQLTVARWCCSQVNYRGRERTRTKERKCPKVKVVEIYWPCMVCRVRYDILFFCFIRCSVVVAADNVICCSIDSILFDVFNQMTRICLSCHKNGCWVTEHNTQTRDGTMRFHTNDNVHIFISLAVDAIRHSEYEFRFVSDGTIESHTNTHAQRSHSIDKIVVRTSHRMPMNFQI